MYDLTVNCSRGANRAIQHGIAKSNDSTTPLTDARGTLDCYAECVDSIADKENDQGWKDTIAKVREVLGFEAEAIHLLREAREL